MPILDDVTSIPRYEGVKVRVECDIKCSPKCRGRYEIKWEGQNTELPVVCGHCSRIYANKGRSKSPETIQKMSDAKKGKPQSLEHRAKLSRSQTERWRKWHAAKVKD